MKRILSVLLVIVLVVSSSGSVAVAQTDVPAGMVGVPDANVSEDVPLDSDPPLSADELEGSVMASDHAESLEVIVTTPDRAADYLDDGAELSGSKGLSIVLQDDTHSAGRDVAIDAGAVKDALGYTPERVYGTHEDGEAWSRAIEYQGGMLIFEVPHFSSNSVTFSSEVSLSGNYTDGSSVEYSLSDVDAVNNFSVQFTGRATTETDTVSVGNGGSTSSTISGSTTPSSATVDVSWPSQRIEDETVGSDLNGDWRVGNDASNSWSYSDVPAEPTTVTVDVYDPYDEEFINVTVTDGSGTVLATKEDPSAGKIEMQLDISDHNPGSITVQVDVQTTDANGVEAIYIDGETPDPVDLTVDGTTKSWSSQGSKTISLDDDSSVDVSTSGSNSAPLTASVSYEETSYSPDPTVEVNGVKTAYSGTLDPGETATVSPSTTSIESSNSVNVTLGGSSDAPTPSVHMEYVHEAQDNQTVEYDGTKWTESYNVSKTFASDRSSATLTIPFANDMVGIESLESRTNGGSWSGISGNDYTLTDTELTVQLGSVQGGDTVEVRTTGQQVLAVSSSITVLEPTTPGDRLDSRVRIEEWNEDSSISVGRTEDAGRIHYIYNESWDSADSHAEITAEGTQQLYLPGAGELSEFRVRTVPVRVNARSGEVEISMQNPSTTEPSFYVEPGATANDDVEYTLLTAQDGEEYILRSETNNVVHDSAEASSPVTLVDDDSEELLVIEQDSTTASEDDGPSQIGIGPAGIDTDSPLNSVPVILLVGAVILIGLAVIYRRLGWSIRDAAGPIPVDPVFGLAAGLIAFVVIDYVGGGVLTSAIATNIKQIGSGISQIVPLLGIGGAALLGYWLYQNYILGNSGGGGNEDDSRTIIIRDGGDK